MTALCCVRGQERENVVLIADIGGTNCRFELWDIDLQDSSKHRELFHIVRPGLWPPSLHF